MKLSILMPCLNEVLTLPNCINRAKYLLETYNIDGEVLISDNGSTDGSQEVAEKLGAKVINCPTRGYGAALTFGIENAEGEFIIMGDSDDSYHFDEAYPMLIELEKGFDVCMGTRFKGKIMPDAMPILNHFIGNPALTIIGRYLFNIRISDFHCGMRAFKRDKVHGLGLVTTGMEWATEMLIKSKLNKLKITEVPIILYKDGRNRPPHLQRWRDGWRHLRFMILHAPRWLFIYPGVMLVSVASVSGMFILCGFVNIGPANLETQIILVIAFMTTLGIQVLFTGIMAYIYLHLIGIIPATTPVIERLRKYSLEKMLVISGLIGIAGLAVFGVYIRNFYADGIPELDYRVAMRFILLAITLITISGQAIFNGFMLSILFLKTSRPNCSRLPEP